MKKWLAILSAVLMLLSCVPFTIATVSAAAPIENRLLSGDFETVNNCFWSFFQGSYPSASAALHGNTGAHLQGNGGWGALMEQTAQVTLGKAYHLEFWFKVLSNGFNWRLEQSDAEGLYETRWETAAEWTHVSYDFVASSQWVTLNFCGGGNGIPEQVYVDDVVLCPAVSSDFDGYITNGDFERGDDGGWTTYQYTASSADAALSGAYGAHLQGYGGWGALLEQGFPTKPNETYTVTFFYQVNQNGFNAQIKGSVDSQVLAADWFTATEWSMGELTFVADGDYAVLNFCGAGNGIPEDAYVDDVFIIASEEGLGDDLIDDGYNKWRRYGYVAWTETAAFESGVGIYAVGTGDGASLLKRTVATIEGAEYTLTFYYQNLNANSGFAFVVEDGIGGEILHRGVYSDDVWTQAEITFTAASATTVIRFAGAGHGVPEVFYLDEVVLFTYEEEPAPVQQIKNGDFSHDKALGWSVYQDTVITGYDESGNRGALLLGYGDWGALLEQGFFTTPGGVYALSFRYTVWSNGFNLQIVDGRDAGHTLNAGWFTANEWTEETILFTSASDTTRLNICGGGNGIPETAYIDDIVLTYLGEVPDLPDISYEELVVGETKEVTVPEELGMSFLLFTPAESGWYAFTSYGDRDTYILIADETGESAVFNDNDADGHNFRAVAYCAADTPYVMLLTTKEFSGTFEVAAEALLPAALFPAVTPIGYGDTLPVESEQAGVSQVFSFVPTADGTYILAAAGEEDTYCFLYDVDGEVVRMFDDEFTEEDDLNFAAVYDCKAGNTYYFVVGSYAEGSSSFTVELTAEKEPPTPDEPPVTYGDLNGDGAINNRDLALLQQYINHWDVQVDEAAADTNGDGTINNRDLALLQQYINHWDVTLG